MFFEVLDHHQRGLPSGDLNRCAQLELVIEGHHRRYHPGALAGVKCLNTILGIGS